jgi:catechol 2,3-dioxygenase-like lactoylglutathione lyase family enzyme
MTNPPNQTADAVPDDACAPQVVGLRHIHLRVQDVPAAAAFYEAAFSFRVGLSVHDGAVVFLQTTGGDDLLTLSSPDVPSELDGQTNQPIGNSGGLDHFGICVADQASFVAILDRVQPSGGTVLSQGEIHGAPTAFVRDPDGYAVQVYVMPQVSK